VCLWFIEVVLEECRFWDRGVGMFSFEVPGPVKSQSHVMTDGQSISMSWWLVHSSLKSSIRMNFNPTSGLVD
jgi:hypothetical protein